MKTCQIVPSEIVRGGAAIDQLAGSKVPSSIGIILDKLDSLLFPFSFLRICFGSSCQKIAVLDFSFLGHR